MHADCSHAIPFKMVTETVAKDYLYPTQYQRHPTQYQRDLNQGEATVPSAHVLIPRQIRVVSMQCVRKVTTIVWRTAVLAKVDITVTGTGASSWGRQVLGVYRELSVKQNRDNV